ncbi:MAG TPA: PQQ-binding-like beta-propeller repeat protein [Blastocatellia bacterium]|nr:PQQ-binding-like beta-propeller repeat protein [Blastocatellia bacterium]
MKKMLTVFLVCLAPAIVAQAQSRDWYTDSADAQRSAWIRQDGKINKDSTAKPGNFQFLWKMKLKNQPKQLNTLTPPATLDRLIGYRGFRMLGFVAGSGDNLFTIDTDLGRMEWEKHLNAAPSQKASTLLCPGGMTTGVVRPVLTTIAPAPTNPLSAGRNTPAKSGVGESGQGAVTLANVRPNPPRAQQAPPAANPMLVQQGRVNTANLPGGQLGAGPFLIYALASDGMLHSMHLSNGADYQPPVKFLPPGANAVGLIALDQVVYAVTTNGCGGAANGVWKIDLATKEVKTWKGNVAGSAGMAFGADSTLYVTTGSGGDKPNSLVALDPATLAEKASFSASQEFTSSPVVFSHKSKVLVAAATKDGSIHVFDGASLSAPLTSSSGGIKDFAPGALSSWQDFSGTRWILAAHNGALPAGFTAAGGAVTKGAVLAWRLGDDGKLAPAWASRDLVSPLAPTIINGVVFATSSGAFGSADGKATAAMRAARSGKAVIYALDGTTGKELWNSGTTITSFATAGALSGGMSQIYLTTYDGTIYAFGFPMEH